METTDELPMAEANSCSQTMAADAQLTGHPGTGSAAAIVAEEVAMDHSIIVNPDTVNFLPDGNHSTTTDDHSSMANLDYSGPSSNLGLILAAKPKGKRRRRKTKQKLGTKPYKISSWRYQLAPPLYMRKNSSDANGGDAAGVQRQRSKLVPYNTNKFLMEEHMPRPPRVRGADPTGDSMDSDGGNNYFTSIPLDEEEFLTKEFSSVYESARSERLESMSKSQLMREYLQLEANYDKLSRNLDARKMERDNQIRALEERVRGQTHEIQDLRRQLADSRNRRAPHSHHERRSMATAPVNQPLPFNGRMRAAHSSSSSSSADSDSDSTDTDSSSSGSGSHSSLSASESTPAVAFSPPAVPAAPTVPNGECN